MIYIKKSRPPQQMARMVSEIKSSQEWKRINAGDTKAVRGKFDQLPKEVIRESLLKEQHYLCAYCMRRIKNDGRGTTIEHWYPLSEDKEKALDYRNMLAVCDGGRSWKGKRRKVLCCDAGKGNESKLTVSPMDCQQMKKIIYDKEGFIRTSPRDEDMEKDIKNVLRLNGMWKNGQFIADTSTELVKGRKDAYLRYKKAVKKLGDKKMCTSAKIKKIIREIEMEEQRPEFAGVLLYFFNKKYHELVKRGL